MGGIHDIGKLSTEEWDELVALDYAITWGYSDYTEKDLQRQKELRKKRWD